MKQNGIATFKIYKKVNFEKISNHLYYTKTKWEKEQKQKSKTSDVGNKMELNNKKQQLEN